MMISIKARGAFLFGNRRSVMYALTTYLKHVREEFSHIVWPSSQTAISHTLVVLVIAVMIAVWVGLLDMITSEVVSRIVGA
jgi:preprotein translocase SecE subunit